MKKSFYLSFGKRVFDLVLTVPALVILSPVLVVLSLLVRVKLGSPVLFRQMRPGFNEKPFNMLKFRTMTDAKDKDGKLLPDAERLTRFGAFLRKTSLDELPELINILTGNMSLVGPRPLLMAYLPYYTDREKLRHTVRPGLTGLAQVNGRNFLKWDDRLEMDAKYVETLSFFLDVIILVRTVQQVIKRENIVVIPGAIGVPLSVYRIQKSNRSAVNNEIPMK